MHPLTKTLPLVAALAFGACPDDDGPGQTTSREPALRAAAIIGSCLPDDGAQRTLAALLYEAGPGPSLGDWLESKGYSRIFIDRLIVPQASAIWSADPKQMWSFPAKFLAEFFDNHGMLAIRGRPKWRTVVGGSHR